MAEITQTIGEIGTVPVEGSDTFREDASRVWNELKTAIPQINTFGTQTNAVRNEMNAFANVVVQIKDDSESIKEDIDTQKTQIDNKYTEIMGYTIPTEATYNETTIDAKVRMSQVLSLTNSI
jgi:uncharacterized coiled-coil DUF342 family protein